MSSRNPDASDAVVPTPGLRGLGPAPVALRRTEPGRPVRYQIRESGEHRYLTCVEVPEGRVFSERGFSITATAARRFDEGSIFLDGAAQGEPFLDLERRVFNLDHHEGCIRSFTLATCEQSLVLVLKGLDLREKPWTLYCTAPDLDAILAVWVLLNGRHLGSEKMAIREAVIPLVRLEGAIDTHGLELADLAGLPASKRHQAESWLEKLKEAETEYRKGEDQDPLAYLAEQLRRLDELVFPTGYFRDFEAVDELSRVDLTAERIAVVCSSDRGVYELEAELKELYGKRLGLIVLQIDPRSYTLRQVDPFLPGSLGAVYHRLNLLDPAVAAGDPSNRWGGSAEIGGSPRRTGTRLLAHEIAEAAAQAFRRPSRLKRLGTLALATAVSAVPFAAALVVSWLAGEVGVEIGVPTAKGTAAALVFVALLLVAVGRRRPRMFGLTRPGGWGWLRLAPVGLLAGVLGGSWSPSSHGSVGADWVLLMLGLPLVAELLFRGVVQGLLVGCFLEESKKLYRPSVPVLFQGVLYALWTLLWGGAVFEPRFFLWWALVPPAALVFGLFAGLIRERSGTVLAPLVLHLAAALTLAFAGGVFQ